MGTIFAIILVIIVLVLWAAWASAQGFVKRLKAAKAAHEASLLQLRQNPTDPDLKQQTLALGRAYSNITRDQQGVTVFDEVALSNDINAACAGATGRASTERRPKPGSRNWRSFDGKAW